LEILTGEAPFVLPNHVKAVKGTKISNATIANHSMDVTFY